MSLFSRLFGRSQSQLHSVERDVNVDWFYRFLDGKTSYGSTATVSEKITAYRTNFALQKVIGIIKDVGKLANINLYENDTLKQKNFLYTLKPKPNAWQTWTDFVEEYIVWISLGTAYHYKEPSVIESNSTEYWLNPDWFDNETKKIIESIGKKPTKSAKNELTQKYKNHIVKYKFNGKDTVDLYFKNITPIANNVSFDNWYSGGSVIESISKIISNSESAIDAKNINLHFLKKFLVFQKEGSNDLQQLINGLGTAEVDDIKRQVLSSQSITVSGKSNIELKRFVDRFKELGFDESFLNDYLLIGIAFNVPVEVLENFLKGKGLTSQGDAKEKAFVQFVEMCLMPLLQKLTDNLEVSTGFEVRAEFSHLGFMRVVEKEKAEKRKTDLEALKLAVDMGLDEKTKQEQLKLIYNGN